MGNPKQKWTSEEEEALRNGIKKYGPGKWKFIQRDPEFNQHLHSRSNIDLKDKWRNMSAAAGQGSREKLRTPKPRSNQESTPLPMLDWQAPSSAHAVHDSSAELARDEHSKDLPDPKNGPRYNALIMEALSTTEDPKGLDISSLISYIEQRAEVPQNNFRKLLGSRLRRLVAQQKLEKVDNYFRIKDKSSAEPNPAVPRDNWRRPSHNVPNDPRESLEAAATFAALSLAKAEELAFQTGEAVKEAERVARIAEESAEVLRLANEIFERCNRGEEVPIV